jgi:hypothetical protein
VGARARERRRERERREGGKEREEEKREKTEGEAERRENERGRDEHKTADNFARAPINGGSGGGGKGGGAVESFLASQGEPFIGTFGRTNELVGNYKSFLPSTTGIKG